MRFGKYLLLTVALLTLLVPAAQPVFGQGEPDTTPVPNAQTADSRIFLPLLVKRTSSNTQPPASSHPRRIDHNSVALFDRIPERYLTSARNLKLLFSDRSVGQNIHESLNCLTATSWAASPAPCRNDYIDSNWNWKTFDLTDLNSGTVPARIQFTPSPTRYNRSNWAYEFRQGTWTELTQEFIQTMGPTYISRGYDVLSYQFSYLNVQDYDNISNLTTGFFANTSRSDIYDLEAFWARYPNKTFLLWTTSLARNTGSQVAEDFNNQMRNYGAQRNMWVFDVADIESHTDTGVACYDNRDGVNYCGSNGCENFPNDHLNLHAICQDYTTEFDGGHLGSVSGGSIRLVKAFWVLMARISGWDGVSQ
jgi:hypothetical protein